MRRDKIVQELYATVKLKAGDTWRQESILGSVFEGCVEIVEEAIVPTISGRAWITGETTLTLDANDPFCWGIPTT